MKTSLSSLDLILIRDSMDLRMSTLASEQVIVRLGSRDQLGLYVSRGRMINEKNHWMVILRAMHLHRKKYFYAI